MSVQRSIGFPALLFALAACAYNKPNKQVAPKLGPKASIHASYSGGLLNRRVDAVFKVEQAAYTMVAHLGGDGRIEVLYPRDARESGRVPGGKWYRAPSFSAYYDAAPQLYSFATTRFRGLGAQLDSYDGLGHGFVFLIASRYALRFERISDFGLWDEFEAEDYRTSHDPREAVRRFAEVVVGGSEYTLQFARSFGTTAMTSNVDQQFDCAFLSSYGFAALGSPWSYGFGPLAFRSSPLGNLSGCANRYALGRQYYRGIQVSFAPLPSSPGAPRNPDGILDFPRPGGRQPGKPGPALGLNRPAFDQPTTGTTATDFPPRDRDRAFGPRGGDSGGRTAGQTPTRASDPPRSTPTREAPHSSAPRARETPMERSQPQREVQHVQPQREAPPQQTARPSPEARKPPEERKP